jgi:hypothetical protein
MLDHCQLSLEIHRMPEKNMIELPLPFAVNIVSYQRLEKTWIKNSDGDDKKA